MDFDLFVIGTGSAATVAAHRCRAAGWRVAIADHRPFGGTCALRGCDPKKVLIAGAQAIDGARRMAAHGVRDAGVRLDWPALMRFKRSFTDAVPARTEESLNRAGVEVFHGHVRFVGRDRIAVAERTVSARRIVIATGAVPVPLSIAGAEHLTYSDAFLSLDRPPRRLILIGGGYIAAEFSHLAARAGIETTVIQRGDRLLSAFEPELVGWLAEKMNRLGIDVRLRTAAKGIERAGEALRVECETAGARTEVVGDVVVHAAGRTPDIMALDLTKAEVAHDRRGLALNEYGQSTTNPAIYAAGDAAARGPMLTPIAVYDGEQVAANLLQGNHVKSDYRVVPSAVFTLPPLAAVGMTEAAAKRSGRRYRVKCERTSDWYTARHVGEDTAGYKVLIDEQDDRVIGAHLIGPHADNVINVFALAMRADVRAAELKTIPWAYPTSASDIRYML